VTIEIKKAMVLTAGLGTRMLPLTKDRPKPLLKVGEKTLLSRALDELEAGGVNEVIVNLHYCADQIEDYLCGRAVPEITYSDERAQLMETGGGLKRAENLLGERPFFSCNTDAFFYGPKSGLACELLRNAWRSNMEALLLLVPLDRATGFDGNGDFHLYDEGKIVKAGDEPAPYAFTGLQILHPILLDDAPETPFSTRDLWKKAASRNALYGMVYPYHWLHTGTPQGIIEAENQLKSLKNIYADEK